MVQFETLGTIF